MSKILLCLLFSLPAFGQDTPVIRLSKQLKASPASVVQVYGYFDYHYKSIKDCDQSKKASIVHHNKISPCFNYLRSFEKDDAKKIIRLLNNRRTYGHPVDTTCFETHYALLILENNVVTGYVNISLSCNRIISGPGIPAAATAFSPKGKDALQRALKLITEEPLSAPLEN